MAALLIAISVMAVMLSMALPSWSFMIRREKEEELIFRGNQYARAISLYQRGRGNAFPTSVDVLIEQRFLRKKFKDPLSPEKDGEFQLIYQGQQQAAGQQQTPGGRGASAGASGTLGTRPGTPGTFGTTSGPIVGVVSKNTGASIRIYKGKQKYNEWQFTSMDMANQAGAGAGGSGPGGTRGGPPRGSTPPRGGRGADGSFTTPDGGTTFTPARGVQLPPQPR